MRAWSAVFCGALCLLLGFACQVPITVTLETEQDKTLYAIGLSLASRLIPFKLKDAEIDIVVAGLRDGVLEKPVKVDPAEYRGRILSFQQARSNSLALEERKASEAFLEKEAAHENAIRTASGLIYREVQAGSGEKPKPTDTVRVHYHGTLRDGKVFDSSVDRGQPFVTKLANVIPCWTEGIQLLSVGGKGRLVCPADIAYRDSGAPPHIKPGAALAFDVELLEIVK